LTKCIIDILKKFQDRDIKLIADGKNDKALKIIELAMTKMPLEKFNYYSVIEPFAKGYYALGQKTKARQLLEKLITKYKEKKTARIEY
jgi:hypothetical protein